MANELYWFEIPVKDMDRACTFYGAIFGISLNAQEAMPGYKMAMFPERIGGALLNGEGYTPSQDGVLVYLNAGDDLKTVQDRVEGAGGKVLQEKTSIGTNGFMAFFEDSEGNKVGLHSLA